MIPLALKSKLILNCFTVLTFTLWCSKLQSTLRGSKVLISSCVRVARSISQRAPSGGAFHRFDFVLTSQPHNGIAPARARCRIVSIHNPLN
jgi:hypothetical protein